MRTIIINTLGRELNKNPLFFLPFEEDQLLWLEQDLSSIDSCIATISSICNDQIKRQDYRLVVLADPVSFHKGQFPVARKVYEQLILAIINHKLLSPLMADSNLVPRSFTIVYHVAQQSDGTGGINPNNLLANIFGITAEQQPITQLRITRKLPGGNTEDLDVTELFTSTLKDHQAKMALRQQHQQSSDNSLVFNVLHDNLAADLKVLQICSYIPTGSSSRVTLTIHQREFIPKTTDPQLMWADLQLNLCDHLVKQVLHPNQDVEMQLPAHNQKELEARISRASSRVDFLLNNPAYRQTYHPLVNQPRTADAELKGKIWESLSREACQLPGVENARKYNENPDMPRADQPTEKLDRAWFLVNQEIRQFHQLCTRLDAEYNDELVAEQQNTILNICAQAFREWRSRCLRMPLRIPDELVGGSQPELDDRKLQAQLAKSQQKCTRATVEKLADYSDVRQEAEVIKAGFRMAGRFWSPDCKSANSHNFRLFSSTMAILFLVQMLLPYMGITLGQANVSLDRFAHFILSALVFSGIYCVGMLIWLRGLCEELHGYSEKMSKLIHKSSRRREDSIEAAVEAYSSVLPQCMNLRDNLRELQMIHQENNIRKTNYDAHMQTLKDAKAMLQNLATQLQLPDSDRYASPVHATKALDYRLPPSSPVNMCFYTLLSDKWGGDPSC